MIFQKKIIDIDSLKIPEHIAIIMDGNGRWATKKNLPRNIGHKKGVEALKDVIKSSDKFGVKYLTLYAFSTENWSRPKEEVNGLMELLVVFLRKELNELHKNNVKIRILGDYSVLPDTPRQEVAKSIELTKNNDGLVVCIALNYGSRDEMIRGIKEVIQDYSKNSLDLDSFDYDTFSNYLFTKDIPDPDLLIRTSGEIRLSNFLLCQIAYSELYFTDVLWPDFNENELVKAIKEYNRRNRRYGKI